MKNIAQYSLELVVADQKMKEDLVKRREHFGLSIGDIAEFLRVPYSEIQNFEEDLHSSTMKEIRLYKLAICRLGGEA